MAQWGGETDWVSPSSQIFRGDFFDLLSARLNRIGRSCGTNRRIGFDSIEHFGNTPFELRVALLAYSFGVLRNFNVRIDAMPLDNIFAIGSVCCRKRYVDGAAVEKRTTV